MRAFFKEFKDFIATGNVIELAVAVILGAAINQVVQSFTNGIMMQIVAAIFGQPDFSNITITLRKNVGTDEAGNNVDSVLRIGDFINTLINLAIVGLVLFIIIKAYNKMKKQQPEAEADATEVDLLVEIRDLLANRPTQP